MEQCLQTRKLQTPHLAPVPSHREKMACLHTAHCDPARIAPPPGPACNNQLLTPYSDHHFQH